jgi:thiamine biosynthesis lipoprotein
VSGEVVFRHAEPVMGTVISFDVRPHGLAYERTRTAIDRACALLHRADAIFSLYRPDSPLSRLRRGELRLEDCPREMPEVLALCERAREDSAGWFDPWAMSGSFDPTGLVKGWAADRAAAVLQQAGVGAAMVNAAGDIAVFGRPGPDRGWRIGVRAVQAHDRLLCTVDVEAAIATSGSYERGDHVRDPRTGAPASGAASATVCGPDLAFADAFATGLLAAGEPGLEAVHRAGYTALIVEPDGTELHTEAFPFATATAR